MLSPHCLFSLDVDVGDRRVRLRMTSQVYRTCHVLDNRRATDYNSTQHTLPKLRTASWHFRMRTNIAAARVAAVSNLCSEDFEDMGRHNPHEAAHVETFFLRSPTLMWCAPGESNE